METFTCSGIYGGLDGATFYNALDKNYWLGGVPLALSELGIGEGPDAQLNFPLEVRCHFGRSGMVESVAEDRTPHGWGFCSGEPRFY